MILTLLIGLMETWLKEETAELYELSEYKSIHLTRPSRNQETNKYGTIWKHMIM